MGSQDVTHNSSFYISLGVQVLILLVLLGLAIVGIVIAVRAKTGTGKGCGIVMAVAFALQSCLAAFFFLISFFAGLESSSSRIGGRTQTIAAKDGSCEISVPKSWINSPELAPFRMDLHNGLDLNCDALRKVADADRGASMAAGIAEQLDKKVGTTIDHRWLITESRTGINESVNFQDPFYAV